MNYLEAIIFEPKAKPKVLTNRTGEQPVSQSWLTAAAFEQLFKKYYRELVVYAVTIMGDDNNAEEIVQQVYYKLWEKKADIVFDSSQRAYLYKSVYHASLNYIKHQQVKRQHVAHVLLQGEPLGENAGGRLGQSELLGKIMEAVNALPQQCRMIFLMSRKEELSYREIAERLSISVKTVEAQMGKALRIMREKLVDYLVLWLAAWSTWMVG